MAYKSYDTKPKLRRGVKRVNQNTLWGTVLVEKGKPRLLVDGVFYDIPFTKDIASKVKYIVNTDLNPKSIPYLIKENQININDVSFDSIAQNWSYVFSGQKVRCNRIDGTFRVNIDFINSKMKKEYDLLVSQYPNYSKFTYICHVKLLR